MIAEITNTINMINPMDEVAQIDRYEKRRFFAHGSYSDLTTFHKISDTLTIEHRWVKYDDEKYSLSLVAKCFSDSQELAEYAASVAIGSDK